MTTKHAEPTPEPSLADHVHELAAEISTRVRQELAHAVAELSEKVSYAGRQTRLIGVGAICSAISIVVLAGAAVFALGRVLPMWAAALVISAVLAAVGQILARKGLSALRSMSLIPTETLATIGDDTIWVKHELHETLDDAKRLVVHAVRPPARRRRKATAHPRKPKHLPRR